MQHDPLQQRIIHGQNPQQDLSTLPAEEVQQVREVHHVSRRWQLTVSTVTGFSSELANWLNFNVAYLTNQKV